LKDIDEVEKRYRDRSVEDNDLSKYTAGKATTELSQIEAKLNKLQEKGVDSIQTADLSSGKELAKDMRKKLNKDIEVLFDRMQALFAEFEKETQLEKERVL
jgi:hypothetical protein